MVPTADHNAPQRMPTLSRQIVAGCPGECKKIILRPFLTSILTLKTVLQSAPEEHAILMQKIDQFSAEGPQPPQAVKPLPQRDRDIPSRTHLLGAYGASTIRAPSALDHFTPPLQNPG